MDNDEGNKEYLADLVTRGLVDSDDSHLWDSDFEEDNFGVQRVVDAISKMLQTQGRPPITAAEIEEERKHRNLVLMRAVRQAYGRKQHENPFRGSASRSIPGELRAMDS